VQVVQGLICGPGSGGAGQVCTLWAPVCCCWLPSPTNIPDKQTFVGVTKSRNVQQRCRLVWVNARVIDHSGSSARPARDRCLVQVIDEVTKSMQKWHDADRWGELGITEHVKNSEFEWVPSAQRS
jgi:hypothetical protein